MLQIYILFLYLYLILNIFDVNSYNFSINTMKALVIVGILIIINGVVNRIRKVGIKNYFNWNFDS
jgi:hypothetical protein